VADKIVSERRLDGDAKVITVRVKEACRITGIGRSKLYMLIQEGHVEVVKVGSMTLIPMRSLEKFLGVDAR
jgi:excisionase family DNA binding protein